MRKFAALFCVAALILCAVPVMADEEVDTADEPVVEETAAGEDVSSEGEEVAAFLIDFDEAIPSVEGSIFIAPLDPEKAQPLMDVFADINEEEDVVPLDLAILLAGEENELTEEESDALMEALEGYDVALSCGYLTEAGEVIIDAASLGLNDGDFVKLMVMEDGEPAIIDAEVINNAVTFEVNEPSVCFVLGSLADLEDEEEVIPTVEGSIFIAPLDPEKAQPLMDMFADIDEEDVTALDLAVLLAGEDAELTEEEMEALTEELDGYEVALSSGYLTEEGEAIVDAEALGLEIGDSVVGIILADGNPAVFESQVDEGCVFSFDVAEPSVCFLLGMIK